MPCVLPLLLGRVCTLGPESRRGSPGFVPPSGDLLSGEVGDPSSDPHQERSRRPPVQEDILCSPQAQEQALYFQKQTSLPGERVRLAGGGKRLLVFRGKPGWEARRGCLQGPVPAHRLCALPSPRWVTRHQRG